MQIHGNCSLADSISLAWVVMPHIIHKARVAEFRVFELYMKVSNFHRNVLQSFDVPRNYEHDLAKRKTAELLPATFIKSLLPTSDKLRLFFLWPTAEISGGLQLRKAL